MRLNFKVEPLDFKLLKTDCIKRIFFIFSSDAFVYGGEDKMQISAEIINQGEDAFNAMLYLQLPKEVNYMSAEAVTPGLSVLCSPPSPMNNRTLQCDVGNPLPANTKVKLKSLFHK